MPKLFRFLLDDIQENLAIIAALIIIGLFVLSYTTNVDAQTRFIRQSVFTDASGYFQKQDTNRSKVLKIKEKDLNRIYWASKTSIGVQAVGDEDLFCGDVENGKIVKLKPVDRRSQSSLGSVSGSCISNYPGMEIDVFIHSQPNGNCSLSREDKDLESFTSYTGILCEEPAVSPFTGLVDGLEMWKIELENGETVFKKIKVKKY